MKFSKSGISTTKNTPNDAEIISHKLMIRSGMIKKLASGIYTWMPLGLKVLKKIENIIRTEMDNVNALEILMPAIQPSELWEESGRWDKYGPELLRLTDRHEREFCFGPTHEEIITDIARKDIKSYKQLPLIYYQIQTKFRDEMRPRFGVMRGREFLMKDNYSFDLDEDSAKISYNNMFSAYIKTFLRMGLTPISLRAETGPIGGNLSHEFQILASTGESTLYYDKELETLNPNTIDPEKLQSFYAAVDDQHDEKNCPIEKENIKISKGIEVGHIFYFGIKYSEKLNAYVQNKDGKNLPVHMGSYGIGISRLVGAIIEAFHDEKGIKWPLSVAPFHVSIINLMIEDQDCRQVSDYIYEKLNNGSLEVLYDDRNCSVGKKLSDNELIGIPFQIVIGKRDLKDNIVELKNRLTNDSKKMSPEEVTNFLFDNLSLKS